MTGSILSLIELYLKLQKAEEKIKKLRKINDDLEKHNEELTLKNNKSNWEYEKAQQVHGHNSCVVDQCNS